MNKFADFPEQPRVMSNEEAIGYFNTMLKEIAEYDPDEIVAVARSGFSYAMWVAQILKKPLG
jgi:adenine/guanine phosphoribosyltransferase-like PRPP-binding protein